MKNTRNIILAICIGGLTYCFVELFKPVPRHYYDNVYGTMIPVEYKTDNYDPAINWIGVIVSICMAGITLVIQPFKEKKILKEG